jgi:hypothetical protein
MPHTGRVVTLVMVLVEVLCVTNAASQTQRVQFSYSLASDQVSLHEPIIVTFRVRNNLGEAIRVDLGWQGAQNFSFTLKRPNGKQIELRPPLREGFTPSGNIEVAPGQTYVKQMILSNWFDFDTPGRYQITALLTSPVKGQAQQVVAVDAGSDLVVNIISRDEQRLQRLCAELVGPVASAQSYSEAEKAAKALSAISDPIAVPFLEQVTGSSWHLGSITIAALARIGDSTAIDALISLLRSKEPDAKALARSSLMRIQTKITDEGLKERIRQGLQSEPVKD